MGGKRRVQREPVVPERVTERELAFAAGWQAADEWGFDHYNEAVERWLATGDECPPEVELEQGDVIDCSEAF